MLSPRSCRTRSPGLSSSLPLASIPFFQGGFHTNTRSQVNLSPTDIRLCGIRLGVAVCGGDDEDKANRWSSERRVPSSLGLSRVATEEDEVNGRSSERRVPSPLGLSRVVTDKVNLFCHYFRNPKTSDFFGQKYGCFASKVRMFASKKSDVFEFPFLWDVSAFFLLPPPKKKSFVKILHFLHHTER